MFNYGRKHWLLNGVIVVLGLGMVACAGGAPGLEGPGAAPGQKTQLKLTQAGFGVVDPAKFEEPPEGAVGWIPPEDLTATPKRGGVFKFTGGWTRLDPHFPNNVADGRGAVRAYANGLLDWDLKTNSAVLDLAESWEASPDNLSYTFKIRKGVRFHNLPPVNGRELKAEDVKWSLDRLSGITRLPGQTSFNYARFDTLKEVQVVDDYTVRLIMKQPDNIFLRELMFAYSVVLPKEAAVNGEFSEGKTLIGTGPFMVDLAQAGPGVSRFKRNPDYFNKGPQNKPYLDGIEMHGFGTSPMAAPAFKTKQVDKVIGAYSALKVILNDKDLAPQLRVYNGRGNIVGITGLSLNPNVAPLTDIRIRRAIHLGLDRDENIALAWDGSQGAYVVGFLGGYWQPWFWSEEKLRSLPGWRQPKDQDLAEARKLLAEAGYPSGLTINTDCDDIYPAVCEVIPEQLKRIGIKVNLKIVSTAVLRFTSYMKDKQTSYTTQGGLHTPDAAITQSYLCNSQKNQSAVCDQELEKLWKEFRQTFDAQKAAKILDQFQQRLYDTMVFAPTVRSTSYHIAYKYARGWRNGFYDVGAAHGSDLANVWLDK